MGKLSKVQLVKNFISEEIRSGRIKKGQRLPSCREVSASLDINKITVNKAYNELEKEHKVYSIPRGGFYLLDLEERRKVVQKGVDFRTVKPDERLIPYREFTHVMNQAIDLYKNSLFGYEEAGGLSSLRTTLKEEFQKDGIYTSQEQIIITHGAQQGIGLVLQTLYKNNNKKLLVEAPTYSLVLKLADHLGIDVIGIKRGKDGLDYKELESIFKSGEISAFYVIPRHHNPTGYSLWEKDKQKIAELSGKYNLLVIEDDYLADLGARKGSMPIHYYDINESTIYIRSFSKAFMPGIRMGAAVLPDSLVERVLSLKHITDLNTSKIPQAALDIFIKCGMYEKHIKKVKKAYEGKLRKIAEIFKALCPEDINWHVPEHGIFVWLQLPNSIDSKALEEKLEEGGILVKSTSEFFPAKTLKGNNGNINCLRLCISAVPEEDIEAFAILFAVIKDIRKAK